MELNEFSRGLSGKLGFALNEVQYLQIFKEIDQNGDFSLSYEEFSNFIQNSSNIEIKPLLRLIRK